MHESLKIEKKIRAALKEQQQYTKALDMIITSCACSYCVMVEAFNDIEENGITVEEVSREGNVRRVINPAVRAMLDGQEATRKALRELKLTAQTLATTDNDEVVDLINEVNNVK